ncbi:tRNA pseudouridine(55) synthase TruB [Kineococcus rhizosphaerae]|uniref:tRNA pseudouridine synthase B n=1 Tax=Kineococcus rhizosphaerae TaxID=559628 RepID=A0A2T0RBK2_9ACTN|nr:tRNA pseudouridine(55) synthase TruB [Kineococcus rhizosphaerae]PRY18542.1 tRNA pseudouridine synthase B [Kineococcus rhizosphaerae]
MSGAGDRAGTGVGDGILVVDKPAGWTSHDVVGRCRRLLSTRRVGHAGTLDPAATGVLVLGANRGTKFLTHLVAHDKEYTATVRLGLATITDDAEGEPLGEPVDATGLDEDDAVAAAVAALTGPIQQVPSSVSAIKVDGRRSYARVRGGEEIDLPPRPVTVSRFDVLARRTDGPFLDLDVVVAVSSGTYVRALARDLGRALGVGGHLTALRRTRSGPFTLDQARTLEQVEAEPRVEPLAAVARRLFPVREVDEREAANLAHGGFLTAGGVPGTVAAFAPDGTLVALVEDTARGAKPVLVVAAAG